MKRCLTMLLAAAFMFSSAGSSYARSVKEKRVVKSVILMIGDGMGIAHMQTGMDESGMPLNMMRAGHTVSMVPLMAYGAGSESFGGFIDNTDISKMIKKLWDLR